MTTPSPARTDLDRGRSRAELAALREAAFSRMLDLVFDGHPYYRGVFARVGLRRSDLTSLAQLARLPETPKSAFTEAPDDFVLRPTSNTGLTLPERTIWGAIYTSGTSGGDPDPVLGYGLRPRGAHRPDARNVPPGGDRCDRCRGQRLPDLRLCHIRDSYPRRTAPSPSGPVSSQVCPGTRRRRSISIGRPTR